MGHNKELIRFLLDFGDLDLIFKVTSVETLKIQCVCGGGGGGGAHLFALIFSWFRLMVNKDEEI